MKKRITKILSFILISSCLLLVGLLSTNNKVDAWSPSKGTEDGYYISDLKAFQGWYSDDIGDAIREYGYKDDYYHVINDLEKDHIYDLNKGCGASTDNIALVAEYTNDPKKAITYIYADVNYDGSWSSSKHVYVNGFNAEFYIVGRIMCNKDHYGIDSHQDFNATAGGAYVYLYYTTDSRVGCPIKQLVLEVEDDYNTNHTNGNFVKRLDGEDADFNHGTSGKHLYLRYVADGRFVRTLTYNVNGTEFDHPICVYSSLPGAFTDISGMIGDNLNFAGWFYDKEFTQPAYEYVTIDTNYVKEVPYEVPYFGTYVTLYRYNVKLYAKLTHDKFSITFNTNGANETYDKITDVTSLPSVFNIPTKDGYYFTGWYYDEGLTKKANVNDDLYSDVTLYAGFEEGQLIKNISLFFNNDKYNSSNVGLSNGFKLFSFNLGSGFEDYYSVNVGITYTEDTSEAITNIILLDSNEVNKLTTEDKSYVDSNGITYYPVKGVVGEEKDFMAPINSSYDEDYEYVYEDETKFYLYYTKDLKAGKPIKDIKYTNKKVDGYENINKVSNENTNLSNISFSRYTNMYTGSVLSKTSITFIIVGAVIIVLGGAFAFYFSKKKKKITNK